MKKIFLFCFPLLLIFSSCSKKIETPTYSHRDLLGLKGNVKKIRFTFYEYEITETSYFEVGKTTPLKRSLYNFLDYNVQAPYFFSDNSQKLSDIDYKQIVVDPFTISIISLKKASRYFNLCDTFEIEFNENGNIISCSGFALNDLYFRQEMKYDSLERLTFVSYKNKNSVNKEFYKYEYNELNLIKKSIHGWENSDIENINIYKYNFKDNEIKVAKVNDSKERNYKLVIDENNIICELLFEDTLKLNFKNGLLVGINKYENGKHSYSEEYNFTELVLNSISFTIRTDLQQKSKFSQFSLSYNSNFDISTVVGILNDEVNVWKDIKFDYILDIKSNWTQQSYYRDRKKYDEYKRKIEGMMSTNEYYLENYGVYYYHMAEIMMVSKELAKEKKFCSKTVVDREIIYFD